MSDNNNFPILFNSMIHNFQELTMRLNFIANEKNNYQIFKQVENNFKDIKDNIKYISNLIDNINNKFDDIYANYGMIKSVHPELVVNCFTESNSDISYSDSDLSINIDNAESFDSLDKVYSNKYIPYIQHKL